MCLSTNGSCLLLILKMWSSFMLLLILHKFKRILGITKAEKKIQNKNYIYFCISGRNCCFCRNLLAVSVQTQYKTWFTNGMMNTAMEVTTTCTQCHQKIYITKKYLNGHCHLPHKNQSISTWTYMVAKEQNRFKSQEKTKIAPPPTHPTHTHTQRKTPKQDQCKRQSHECVWRVSSTERCGHAIYHQHVLKQMITSGRIQQNNLFASVNPSVESLPRFSMSWQFSSSTFLPTEALSHAVTLALSLDKRY